MATVTIGNSQDPIPAGDAFLFVNITGPTDGRRREASTQRKIRQHVMRDAVKARRKPPGNRRHKLNTAAVPSKTESEDETNYANAVDASEIKGRPEEERDRGGVTGTTVFHLSAPERRGPAIKMSATTIDEGALDALKRHLPEHHQSTSLLNLTLEGDPLAALYQRLVGTSRFPAYSLAYTVTQNVKLDHKPGRGFLFPFAFKEAPFSDKVLFGRQVQEMIRSSPDKSVMMALKRFTDVVNCIRRRLASPDVNIALSDDTIVAVIDSICYNFALEDLAQARCHLDGLHMMVKARGGFSSFAQKPNIQLMISWIDVTAALIFERIPRFPLPIGLLPTHHRTGTSATWDLLRFVGEVEPQSDDELTALSDALGEVASIAKTIESELFARGDAAWHDTVFLGNQVNSVAHLLLSTLETDCEKQSLPISMSIRFGIALFVIILKQQSRACPAPSTPYVSKVVGLIYQSTPIIPSHMSSSLFTLKLWLLLLCTIAYPDTALLFEIRMMIMGIMKQSKLNSWDEVLSMVRLMPWIEKFESRKGFGKYLIDDD
ncbi:hypothetical protein V8C42DRAFT_322852 [Trichoderma barbatum]